MGGEWGKTNGRRFALALAMCALTLGLLVLARRGKPAPLVPVRDDIPWLESPEVVTGVGRALIRWITPRAVPTVLWYRLIEDPGPPPRIVRKPGARRRHEVTLSDLPPFCDHAVRAIYPDGRRSMQRVFRCPTRLRINAFKTVAYEDWPPGIAWATDPPSRAAVRYRQRGRSYARRLGDSYKSEHVFRPSEWDPLYDLEKVQIIAETIGGRNASSGVVEFHGLPEQWLQALEVVGRRIFWREMNKVVRRAAGVGAKNTVASAVRSRLCQWKLHRVLDRLLPVVGRAFHEADHGLGHRTRIYNGLLPLRRVDLVCMVSGVEPIFRVAKAYEPFVLCRQAAAVDEGGLVLTQLRLEGPAHRLVPANGPMVAGATTPAGGESHRLFTHAFSIGLHELDGMKLARLSIDARPFPREIYFEVLVNGRLRLWLHRAGQARDVGKGRICVRFDSGILRAGRNELSIAMLSLTEDVAPASTSSVALTLRVR